MNASLCCQHDRLENAPLPFSRFIQLDYYDGSIAGFTLCDVCGQVFFFKLLEWNDMGDNRVFRFSAIDIDFEKADKYYDYKYDVAYQNIEMLPKNPFPEPSEYEKELTALCEIAPITHICVSTYFKEGLWRKTIEADKSVTDWKEYLGLPDIEYDDDVEFDTDD